MRNCKTKSENFAQNHLSSGDNYIARAEGTAFTGEATRGEEWIIDSGASQHMCNSKESFSEMKELNQPIMIRVGNNEKVEANHIGTVKISTKVKNKLRQGNLHNVLYAPNLAVNLFSVGSCIAAGNKVIFNDNQVGIYNKEGKMIANGIKNRGLFKLNQSSSEATCFIAESSSYHLWHSRLGHLGGQNLKKLKDKGMVKGLENENFKGDIKCEICLEGKMTKLPTHAIEGGKGTTRKLQMVHTDVCGPIKPEGLNGEKYFVAFTDDFTRKSWVFTMKRKNEMAAKFKLFVEMVNNNGVEKVQTLLSDNGGEYIDDEVRKFCEEKGIIHDFSAPYVDILPFCYLF